MENRYKTFTFKADAGHNPRQSLDISIKITILNAKFIVFNTKFINFNANRYRVW